MSDEAARRRPLGRKSRAALVATIVVLVAGFLAFGDGSFSDDAPPPSRGGTPGAVQHPSPTDTQRSADTTSTDSASSFVCGLESACQPLTVTRAHFASYIGRISSTSSTPTDQFTDDDGSVHEDDVDLLARAAVLEGCGPRSFCPDEPVTRADAAAWISRALDLPPASAGLFEDTDDHPLGEEITGAAQAGIVTECAPTSFCPDAHLTQDAMASWIRSAFEVRPTGPGSAPDPPEPDVVLSPRDDVAGIVSSAPTGTVFLFTEGRYERASVEPKDGQAFYSQDAVFDGQGVVEYAFKGHADDVTISGFEITGYVPKIQHAPIIAKTHEAQEGGNGWVVEYNEVHHNATAGISLSDRSTMRRNRVHHNGQIGVKVGWAPNGALVEENEIFDNNPEDLMDGWEDGGGKFAVTRGIVVRGNYVHGNHGPGLWTDIDNVDSLHANNVVVGNTRMGIYHEISYSAVIRDNVVVGNGLADHDWLWGAGVAVAASQEVEVAHNYLSGNGNEVALIQQDRGVGAFGPYVVRDVDVHHNVMVMRPEALTGAAEDVGDAAIFTERMNRFRANTYVVESPGGEHWAWAGDTFGFGEWLELESVEGEALRTP